MLENTLPELEQLIEHIIEKNNELKTQVSGLETKVVELEEQNTVLSDENETFQLEALEGEEKQKKTEDVLTSLLGKLQSAKDIN